MSEWITEGPVDPEQQDESQQPYDDWSPSGNDPAFEAGYRFVEQNRDRADQYAGNAPMWFGWMVRQGFWEGVKFARAEQQAEIDRLRAVRKECHA